MGADVSFLASPVFAGREAGTAGADSAAEFLARRYHRIGLHPAFHSRCASTPACPGSYFQYFQIESSVAHNVGAFIEGSDPLLRTQFVVLGAHYDHLGRSPTFSLDRERGFVIRPGADDNASGTAALLELARRFHDRPARRSLLIVNFDAEELGLIGSRVFLDNAPVPPGSMRFMLNLDMIGRLRENQLFIEGVGQRATRALIDSAVAAVGIRAEYVADAGRSDHSSFLASGIDAVMLSTGIHRDYHKASDIATRVDLTGMERVVDVAELIARRMADR
jgi:Zn-dependent M28 family amino/carboxypeptidase